MRGAAAHRKRGDDGGTGVEGTTRTVRLPPRTVRRAGEARRDAPQADAGRRARAGTAKRYRRTTRQTRRARAAPRPRGRVMKPGITPRIPPGGVPRQRHRRGVPGPDRSDFRDNREGTTARPTRDVVDVSLLNKQVLTGGPRAGHRRTGGEVRPFGTAPRADRRVARGYRAATRGREKASDTVEVWRHRSVGPVGRRAATTAGRP